MELAHLDLIWRSLEEEDAHNCIEEAYKKSRYTVRNIHRDEPRNEDGIDLICRKPNKDLYFCVKKKPVKKDIRQLIRFSKHHNKGKLIYIYLLHPSIHFKREIREIKNKVEFWDAKKLHDVLLEKESVLYLKYYFSFHPIYDNLLRIFLSLYRYKDVNYPKHTPSRTEIVDLWGLKDHCVKLRAVLAFISTKWNDILMTKSEIDIDEFQEIINAVFADLHHAIAVSAKTLSSGFQNLARMRPYLIGKYWSVIRPRTNWGRYVALVEALQNREEIEEITRFKWLIPSEYYGESPHMRGFHSAVNYMLQNLATIAKDFEDGVDWIFDDIIEDLFKSNNTQSNP
jgi:hypothetical protein